MLAREPHCYRHPPHTPHTYPVRILSLSLLPCIPTCISPLFNPKVSGNPFEQRRVGRSHPQRCSPNVRAAHIQAYCTYSCFSIVFLSKMTSKPINTRGYTTPPPPIICFCFRTRRTLTLHDHCWQLLPTIRPKACACWRERSSRVGHRWKPGPRSLCVQRQGHVT